jgi:hypothetical protein
MSDPFAPRSRKVLHWGFIGAAFLLIATILIWPFAASAANPGRLCDTAAQAAAQRHGVPLDVMRAIALVETGRKLDGRMEPWPWAIHAEGRSHWPISRKQALALVQKARERGVRNIDLGCFQINLHWHGARFASLDDMIDPERNADYAARLLKHHKARLGSWEAAAGAYHSATPALAARYRARVASMRGRHSPLPDPQPPRAQPVKHPTVPGQMGSLVPQAIGAARSRLIDLGPRP